MRHCSGFQPKNPSRETLINSSSQRMLGSKVFNGLDTGLRQYDEKQIDQRFLRDHCFFMTTDYHAKYYAHELTKRCPAGSMEKFAGTLVDAQVERRCNTVVCEPVVALTQQVNAGKL
ncbi:hypothetical protein MNBD_GAMMA13-2128 [hydrothermal vent metagenome]|uniref:Uncharacterized protein n=1 Tax=hydrothermal vent metagenome TaxID=652676 RepID=A0A3B0YM25_9ZZZZ